MNWTRNREIGLSLEKGFQRSLAFDEAFAKRLRLDSILVGHDGCVNRMSWNATGTRLSSASDDRRVFLWNYPDTSRDAVSVRTQHASNIFGVQFLPETADHVIVTGAMDATVQLHDLESHTNYSSSSTSSRHQRAGSIQPHTTLFRCHNSRVKDVEVEPMNPHNFWSVGEDGLVAQYDRRCTSPTDDGSTTALIQVMTPGGTLTKELKGLDLCKARPHLLGLACGDPFIRVYDRRKLSPGTIQKAAAAQPLLELAPPHLIRDSGYLKVEDEGVMSALASRSHTTYVNFSSRGDKLVGSYYADHVYVFDVTSCGSQTAQLRIPSLLSSPSGSASTHTTAQQPRGGLQLSIESLQREADTAASAGRHEHVIRLHSQVLASDPTNQRSLLARASALLQRAYRGDGAMALKDCELLLKLGPHNMDAAMLKVKAIAQCGQYACALEVLKGVMTGCTSAGQHEELLSLQQLYEGRLTQRTEVYQASMVRYRRRMDAAAAQMGRRRRRAPRGEEMEVDGQEGSTSPSAARSNHRSFLRSEQENPGSDREGGEESEESDRSEGSEEEEDVLEATEPWWPFYGPHSSCEHGAVEEPPHNGDMHRASSSYGGGNAASSSNGSGSSSSSSGGRSSSGQGGCLRGRYRSVWEGTEGGRRLCQRMVGQLNLHTDIKEVNFMGQQDRLVACGSDDGRVYIYATDTGQLVKILEADSEIANCCQPHPFDPVLATSGIASVVKIWSPFDIDPDDTREGEGHREREELDKAVARNQEHLKSGGARGLFSNLMSGEALSLLRQLEAAGQLRAGSGEEGSDDDDTEVTCRVS